MSSAMPFAALEAPLVEHLPRVWAMSLASPNRFQRWYFAWIEAYCRRMSPLMRAEVERIGRWLCSWRGVLRFWLPMTLAVAVGALILHAFGARWALAISGSVVAGAALPLALLSAWLQPECFGPRKALRALIIFIVLLYCSSLLGFFVGRIVRNKPMALDALVPALDAVFRDTIHYLAIALTITIVAVWGAAFARRRQLEVELALTRLTQERDAAARLAAETGLRLLEGQIRPHFIFNTLASLQHWVDTGDARAAPLPRSLTAFLRQATDAMEEAQSTLGTECDRAGHYLAIMQSRLGERLRFRIDVGAAVRNMALPSGLVLTLVENAVEHGIEPVLAGGTVELVARTDGDAVLLEVRDDGAGLRADAVDGVGLGNSRERLRHQFGERATLELGPATAPAAGTVARLRIVR